MMEWFICISNVGEQQVEKYNQRKLRIIVTIPNLKFYQINREFLKKKETEENILFLIPSTCFIVVSHI